MLAPGGDGERGDYRSSKLFQTLYEELRGIARRRMRSERPDHTLQATALVNEAYRRVRGRSEAWRDERHFLLVAADAMREVLIDHARSRRRLKRGGSRSRGAIDISQVADLGGDVDPEAFVALDRAMVELGSLDQAAEQVVRLRFLAGATVEQVCEALRISPTTVKRKWQFARAWLARRVLQNDAAGAH